jgi:hypothetical protein
MVFVLSNRSNDTHNLIVYSIKIYTASKNRLVELIIDYRSENQIREYGMHILVLQLYHLLLVYSKQEL